MLNAAQQRNQTGHSWLNTAILLRQDRAQHSEIMSQMSNQNSGLEVNLLGQTSLIGTK